MFTALLVFIKTPLGKIVGTIALIGFLYVAAITTIKVHDARIKREAMNEFNRKQLEVTIKAQQEFIAATKRIETLGQTAIEELKKQKEELDKKFSDIEEYLNSPEVKQQDKGSSPILKETIRRLGGQK